MNSRYLRTLFIFALTVSSCSAGTIILGGDDLTDHGSYNPSSGELFRGWKYLALVLPRLHRESSLVGRNGEIVMLGSSPTPVNEFNNGIEDSNNDAYEGYYRALESVELLDRLRPINGASAISDFLEDLYEGRESPNVVAIAGSEAANDLTLAEAARVNARGDALQAYARRGGSLISHGSTPEIDVYGWLRELANITHTNECESEGATLTQTANDLFGDALVDSDIDNNAGPCHDTFTPLVGDDFSAFQPLAVDQQQRVYILVGRGTLVERTQIRMNCTSETTEAGEFTVRLPRSEGSTSFRFSFDFTVPAGTSGPDFEEILMDVLDSSAEFTNPEFDGGLDCTASLPGALQISCPGTIDIRLLELCFDGRCEDINSEFDLNGLGCPEPPCPICDGTPDDEEPVCDQNGNFYRNQCAFESVACLFPGDEIEVAPCPTPAVTSSPTPVPTPAAPSPFPTDAPSPFPTEAPVTSPPGESGIIAGSGVSSSGGIGGTALSLGGLIGVIIAALACCGFFSFFFWRRHNKPVASPTAHELDGEDDFFNGPPPFNGGNFLSPPPFNGGNALSPPPPPPIGPVPLAGPMRPPGSPSSASASHFSHDFSQPM